MRILVLSIVIFWVCFAAINAFAEGIDSNTVLTLHADGADGSTIFTDEIGKTVTANDNAQIDTAQKKFGTGSGLFDGEGDSLTLADSADWYFGTGDFTIDFQFRLNKVGSIGFCGQYADTSHWWNFDYTTADGFHIIDWVLPTVPINFYFTPSSGLLVKDTWYHIALTRSGNDFRAFLDGTQIGTTKTSAAEIADIAGLFYIGRFGEDGAPSYLNGWLDEFRVSKGVARWTSNFTAPTEPYSPPQGIIPEPSSMLLLGFGLFGIAALRKRRTL